MRVSITKSKHGLAPWVVALTAVAWATLAPAVARPPVKKASVTPAEVEAAQKEWCKRFLRIGASYRQGGEGYKKVASEFIDDLYDFKHGSVFFKPTFAFGERTFRTTKEAALSYFIVPAPADEGFALKHWTDCRYANTAGVQTHGNLAIAAGNVCLTDDNDKVITVDKTFVFRKGSDGKLRLCAHHSSVPYKDPAADPCGKSSPAKSGSAGGAAATSQTSSTDGTVSTVGPGSR